jgi:hypothetical protein
MGPVVVVHHQGAARRIGKEARPRGGGQIQARLVCQSTFIGGMRGQSFKEFAETGSGARSSSPAGQKDRLPLASRVYRLQVDLHLTCISAIPT